MKEKKTTDKQVNVTHNRQTLHLCAQTLPISFMGPMIKVKTNARIKTKKHNNKQSYANFWSHRQNYKQM